MLANFADITLSEFGTYGLTTLDQWESVLHLASKWGFESILSLALREILPLASAVDKIVLGRKYGFDDWLTPAFVAVCARAEPLSLEEAKRMDGEDVARIYQAREQARGSSTAVAMEVAQKAVACVFGNEEEVSTTTGLDIDDTVRNTSSTINNLASFPERPDARELSSEHVTMDLSADDLEVDNDLMKALAIWSRICSQLENSNFDHDASGPYNQLGYSHYNLYHAYRADYKSLLTYIVGPQLKAAPLRHLLSIFLQSDLHKHRGTFFTQLFTDIRTRMKEDPAPVSVGTNDLAPVRKTVLRDMVNELCLELVKYDCTFEAPPDLFSCRHRPASLVTNLANASLLTDTTLRACFIHLVPLLDLPDVSYLQSLCALLKDHGNTFDHKSCRDFIDKMFVQLRRYALERRYKFAYKDIVVSIHYVIAILALTTR
jgi:hypothetical protein